MEDKDPKEYWNLVNDLRNKKDKQKDFDVEQFQSFFENLFAKRDSINEDIDKFVVETLSELRDMENEPDFTMEELKKAIKALKKNKSAGLDRIPAELFKALPDKILLNILKIMNKLKTCLQYPDQWALGITTLLFKDGDEEDPNNYRAITVADAISKIYAFMLNERVEKWSNENNIKRPEQIGFEKRARPADHLFVLKTLIDTYKGAKRKLYTCFVDFQKAFDSVWRAGLFYKLLKYGMNTELVNMIKNMYDKTSNV